MNPHQLVSLLQFSDSMFPVGAFAYSDGLETAASYGLVSDGQSLRDWLHHYLYGVFVPCDGRAMAKAISACVSMEYESLSHVDNEVWALRSSRSIRASSISVGKRLLTAFSAVYPGRPLPPLPHGTCVVAYGVVYASCGFSKRDALLAFGYARLAAIVSAAMRLIALGQQEGQVLLSETLQGLPDAVERVLESEGEPLLSFSPRLDIAQMNHQAVYSRLFRS